MSAETEQALEAIQRDYDGRVSHARAMHQMAVTAADSRLQHELDRAEERKRVQLHDLSKGAYTPPLDGLIEPYGVTRLADLPESARRTRIGD